MADYELGGVRARRSGSMLPGVAPSNVYPTADGAEVVIAANADSVFGRLCEAMGRAELATTSASPPTAARGANMAELDESSAAWTATLPATRCSAALDDHGVPAGRIFTAPDMLTDPQYLARDMVQRVTSSQGWDVPMTGVVPRFTARPARPPHRPAPRRAHRRVLRELPGLHRQDELARTGDGGGDRWRL